MHQINIEGRGMKTLQIKIASKGYLRIEIRKYDKEKTESIKALKDHAEKTLLQADQLSKKKSKHKR